MSKRGYHPSPALIVSMIALVAAMSGTALALPGQNRVGSQDIKRGAIKSSDLRDATAVKPEDLHPRAHLWAEVNSEGFVVGASEPDITASRTGPAQGSYLVDFNRGDIGPCAAVAQISGFTPGGNIPAGLVATELATALDAVRVETSNTAGNLADRSFTVAVFC